MPLSRGGGEGLIAAGMHIKERHSKGERSLENGFCWNEGVELSIFLCC